MLSCDYWLACILSAYTCAKSCQSCLTLQCCGLWPTGCCVHGNLQARILEWIARPFSRRSVSGIEPGSSSLQAESFLSELPGKPLCIISIGVNLFKGLILWPV